MIEDHEDDYLEHYGVQGMKWGVRNAETLRKYAGAKGRGVKSKAKKGASGAARGLSRIGKRAAKSARNRVEKVSEKRAAKKQEKQRLKELGYDGKKGREEYEKLRKTTLASHDAATIAKGMHTLSDAELSDKIKRLNTENQVREMARNQENARLETKRKAEEVKKAKKERRASGIGATVVKAVATNTGTYAGKKAVDSLFSFVPNVGSSTTSKARVTIPKTKVTSKSAADSAAKGESVAAEILNVETVVDRKKLPTGRG